MKEISLKQLYDLETALNHLYETGGLLTKFHKDNDVKEALQKLDVAMTLIFNVVDPLR